MIGACCILTKLPLIVFWDCYASLSVFVGVIFTPACTDRIQTMGSLIGVFSCLVYNDLFIGRQFCPWYVIVYLLML